MRTLFKDGLIGGWIAWTRPVSTPTAVPVKNSAANNYFNDVIGNKQDNSFSDGISLNNYHPSIIGHLKSVYYHAHGRSFTIPDNDPIMLTPGVGAYVYGATMEIGTLATSAFDVHWVQVSDIGDNGYYNIQLCNIDGTNVYGKTSCLRTNNFVQEGNVPIQIPPLAAGTVVYARVGASTGNIIHTIKIKLFAHPYNDIT